MSEWLPIESAPKDSAILAFFPAQMGYAVRQDVSVVHWSGWGGGVWENAVTGHKCASEPTHWMPLPNPPTKDTP